MYSKFLKSRHDVCKELVNKLAPKFEYVSILGKQVTGTSVRVMSSGTFVGDSMESQCGFVVKLYNGNTYAEYSFSDITADTVDSIANDVVSKTALSQTLLSNHVNANVMKDEPLVKDFVRENEGKTFTVEEKIAKLTELKNQVHAKSEKVVNAMAACEEYQVSAMFISKNKDLTQYYTWSNVVVGAFVREGRNVKRNFSVATYNNTEKCFEEAATKVAEAVEVAEELLHAELIEPGVYDIITAPSITGLIAHEAFGHGVEMDMFVKQRAKSRHYINKPVASSLVEMHDGAASTLSCASYFFDDDGVLAHDTLIIKAGILQTGISDAVSAMELGTEPTGNGRRQAPNRKAYTRMTNTFFAAGNDDVDDMIKSIKHGYMLFQTSNGMEDPKNWNIQCVAQYGREIKDGKFTGKIVSPVVMSGYVPDLLMSISMVSKDWEVIGSGHCGKGYKEWVPVSDGGPYLKARCKLG